MYFVSADPSAINSRPKVYTEVTCLPIYAFIDKRNITGNTGSPLWGLALKLVAMSSVQNGSKRPVSETFDVACKVSKILYSLNSSCVR